MDMKMEIAKHLSAACGVAAEEIAAAIEKPANADMGDYAYPCFKLAKVLRKAPPMIAQEIGEKIEKPDFISKISIVGAYINFFLDQSFYTKKVLESVLQQGAEYCKTIPCGTFAFYCNWECIIPNPSSFGLSLCRGQPSG